MILLLVRIFKDHIFEYLKEFFVFLYDFLMSVIKKKSSLLIITNSKKGNLHLIKISLHSHRVPTPEMVSIKISKCLKTQCTYFKIPIIRTRINSLLNKKWGWSYLMNKIATLYNIINTITRLITHTQTNTYT